MLLQEKIMASRSLTQTLPSDVMGKCRKGMWRHVIKKKLKTEARQLELYSAAEHGELKDVSGKQASRSHAAARQ